MKSKTIKLFLFTFLMCLGSVVNAQIIQVLTSENYENLEVTDWTCPNGLATLNTDDATYGNYAYLEAQGSGNRSAYKSVVLGDVNEVYIDKYLTTEGYNVEFDAYLRAGQQKDRSASQFIIPTTGPNVTKNNDLYTGTDYVFALSQPTNTTGVPSKEWYINDLTNTVGEVVNLEHAWYHFLITVTKSKVSYEITSGENTIASGAMTTNYETLPTIKGFWTLLGRANGSVRFDNLKIYCYKFDPSRTRVLYERGTTTAWSENDLTEWTASNAGPTSYINNGLVVKVDSSGTSGNYSKIISPTSKTSTLTLRAIWNPGNATGAKNNTNAYLSFGDVKFAFYGSSWLTKVTIGDSTTQLSDVGGTRSRDYIIEVKINQITNEVTYSFNDNGTIVTGSGITGSAGSFNKLIHGLGGKVPGWSNATTLKNIEIKETMPMLANYTINYQARDGVLIKSDVLESIGGQPIIITDEQKTSFSNDDKTIKYYYVKDDADAKTVAFDGSTVVTIILDEAVVATTIHDFEDENKIFTERSRITTAIEYNEELASNVCKFTNAGNAQNGYCFANYNIESLTKYANKITINFDYKPVGGGRSYITIGDASIRGNTGGSSKTTYSNIGAIFRVGMNKEYAQVNSINLNRKKFEDIWLNVNVEIDTLSKKVSYIIKQKSDGTIITEGTEVDYYNASAAKCTQIDFFDYINNAVSYIDNIKITTESIYLVQQLNLQTEDGTILNSEQVKTLGVITGLPLAVEYNDSYYTLDDDRLSGYSLDVSSNYLDEIVTVNYKHSPEVVFFGEWEEKATKTGGSFNRIELNTFSSGIGYSLQQNATPTMSVTFSVAEDGIYSITMPYYNLNNKSRGHSIQLDGTELENKSVAAYTGGTFTTEQYLTAGEHTMGVQITYSLTSAFDYLLVKRNSLPVTITSAGVGTICSPYNLDFTNAENIAAYKAEASDGRINLTRVYNVAAREGVLIRSLNGGAVTEDIPVSSTAFDANEGNEFIGTLVDIASQPSEDEEYRYYILSSKTVNGNKVYGFYLANNKKIGAGKAYLRVPLAAAAKYSFFSFDDETSGIEDVELGITETDSPVYDLFGRKVVNPATGLYIKNGKKFIVK